MPYQPTTNFRDSNGVDLGRKLVTKDYLLSVYGSLLDTLAPGLTFTPELWTWGANNGGKQGINNSITTQSIPSTTFAGGSNWKSLGSGNGAMHYGIKTDGTLWLWGANNRCQLGDNTTVTRSTPVTTFVGGTNWKQVSGWGEGNIAIKTDGTLWAWGDNYPGTVGNNSVGNPVSTPVTTFAGGTNWKQCDAYERTCAAVKTDGTLWVWGQNVNGHLGLNISGSSRATPVTTFSGGTNWKQVSCGFNCMSAVKTDGTLWTWGINTSGQLGINNATSPICTPVTTFAGGTNWKQVSCGANHIIAIKTDGTLWTWGNNGSSQLGDNTAVNRSTPVTTVSGGNNWKQVSGGNANSAALKTDGSLWVWGNNSYAALGAGIGSKATPVTTLLGGNDWKLAHASRSSNSAVMALKSIDYI